MKKGDSLVVLESMKMQVAVKAHKDGIMRSLGLRKERPFPEMISLQ